MTDSSNPHTWADKARTNPWSILHEPGKPVTDTGRHRRILYRVALCITFQIILLISIRLSAKPAISEERAIEHNSAWQPVSRTFTGIEMVLVPPGCFEMGSEHGDKDEQPVQTYCFEDAFWIDRYEVTTQQYETLGGVLADSNCPTLSDAHPVACLEWIDAHSFCAAREARLPTEAEWEYAARGPDALTYPWGDSFSLANVVASDNSWGKPAGVGQKSGGMSWVGAYDMGGNVWEWTSTIYGNREGTLEFSYPYVEDRREDVLQEEMLHVARGGSYGSLANHLRAANRLKSRPGNTYISTGVRCVRDY